MTLAILQADCKRALTNLAHLSNDELDEIINNEEKLEDILKDIDQVEYDSLQLILLSISCFLRAT